MTVKTVDQPAQPAKRTAAASQAKASARFTEEERAAMKERAKEAKRETRRSTRAARGEAESEVLAKLAEMPEADRALGERLHALISTHAPVLSPKLWYGMPAYAREGKVVCFFQGARKFKTRYATLGFSDEAKLDDGVLWPTAFALTEWTPEVETRVAALIKKAVG
ncbi:iron chaperone [Deinococcus humi]|uniref:Uncharacterized protein YdhG (YjbR/CyaY superfamily) n=1 Tax=Deinococcus humi TaxID=662880 RepID=A0A7W8JZ50_9DEIO|nr:DUF1801 domain-containing protein [Deinococcus humi]MBB5365877.1 uncharacterized protein YdhG (YjbR/CyaY superfamily) [Deinococcus humi]GGO38827.1 hypothetical protein GCM10008949_46030 [Deinococcus humi]